MTQEEKQQFEMMRLEIESLKSIIHGQFGDSSVFDKKIVSRDKILSERNGIKLTSASNPTGVEIRTGSAINDAGIKAEVGTLPNGSLYLSSSATQPFFVMVGTTWTLMNIP